MSIAITIIVVVLLIYGIWKLVTSTESDLEAMLKLSGWASVTMDNYLIKTDSKSHIDDFPFKPSSFAFSSDDMRILQRIVGKNKRVFVLHPHLTIPEIYAEAIEKHMQTTPATRFVAAGILNNVFTKTDIINAFARFPRRASSIGKMYSHVAEAIVKKKGLPITPLMINLASMRVGQNMVSSPPTKPLELNDLYKHFATLPEDKLFAMDSTLFSAYTKAIQSEKK